MGHPYAGEEIRRWLPGATLRLGAALLLLPLSLLYWPSYWLVGWLTRRFTDEGDQVATLKLLGGLLLHPLWAALLAVLGGWRWGWPGALVPPVALLVATLGRPVLDQAQEDFQAVRGFLRRRDPAVPALLEARKQLLAAFPQLVRP